MDLEKYHMSIQPKWAKNQWIQTSPTRSPPCVMMFLERSSTLHGTRKHGTHQTGEARKSSFSKSASHEWEYVFFPSEGIFGLCLINVPPLFDRRFLTEKSAWGHQPLSFPWVRCTYLWTHGGIPPDELIRWMDSALTGVFWRLLMSPWVRLGGGVGSDFCYT